MEKVWSGTSPVLLEKKHLLEQSPSSPSRGMVNVWAEFGIHDEIVALYDCVYERGGGGGPKRRLSSSIASFEGRLFLGAEHLCFLSHSVGRVIRICVALPEILAVNASPPDALSIRTAEHQTHQFSLGQLHREAFSEVRQAWIYCRLEKAHGRAVRDELRAVEDVVDGVLHRLREERLHTGTVKKWEKLLQGKLRLPFAQTLIDRFNCMFEESKAVLAVGVLLVTQAYVCFTGTVPLTGAASRQVIPLKEVTSVDKRSGGLIAIFTHTRKYSFSSFTDRSTVMTLLMSVWNLSQQIEGSGDSRDAGIDMETPPVQETEEEDGKDSSLVPRPQPPSPQRRDSEFMDSLGLGEEDKPPDVLLDRYGFTVPKKQWPAYQAAQVKYQKSLQKQRSAWSIFIANNDIDKLIQLHAAVVLNVIRRGIPFQKRGEMWFTLSGAQLKRKGSSVAYSELLTMSSVYAKDIAKDIRRTFPHHPFFRREENIRMLERVLVAYSNRNPAIGYCQSMNFIAAMLLLFLPEEKAFWVLAIMVEDRLQEYFSESMIGTLVDQKVLVELMNEKLPRLAAHCRKHELPIAVATTKWFMCLFVGTLPTEASLRVWDCFFFKGSPMIISAALAVLKLHEEEILRVSSCDKFMEVSSSLGRTCFDADKLIKVALDTIGVMEIKHLNHVRMRFWTDTETKLLLENKKRDMYVLQRSTAFSHAQLESWYSAFAKGELQSSGAFTDCTPRAGPAGGVESEAFVELFATIHPSLGSPQVADVMEALFRHLDVNNDRCMKFKDFVIAANTLCNGSMEEKVRLFFDAVASDGYIDRSSARKLLEQLNAIYSGRDNTNAAHEITSEQVDFDSFLAVVALQPLLSCSLGNPIEASILESAPKQSLRKSDEAKPSTDMAASPATTLSPLVGAAP